MYVHMKKYRSTTYANNSSGWVFLDAAEQIFKITKERVYNDKDGRTTIERLALFLLMISLWDGKV